MAPHGLEKASQSCPSLKWPLPSLARWVIGLQPITSPALLPPSSSRQSPGARGQAGRCLSASARWLGTRAGAAVCLSRAARSCRRRWVSWSRGAGHTRWNTGGDGTPVGLPEPGRSGKFPVALRPSPQSFCGHESTHGDPARSPIGPRGCLLLHPFPRNPQATLRWDSKASRPHPCGLTRGQCSSSVLPVLEMVLLSPVPTCHLWLIFNQLTFTEGSQGAWCGYRS